METRPKRSSILEKDYRERKRQRRRSSGEKVKSKNLNKLKCINKATK
jgi:hypothetical protein